MKNDRVTKILGTMTVPLAIFVHAYTGFAFALVRARAWWHSALMPGFFLTSALLSGIALLVIVALIMDRFRAEKLELDFIQKLTANDDRNIAYGPFLDREFLVDASCIERGWACLNIVGAP